MKASAGATAPEPRARAVALPHPSWQEFRIDNNIGTSTGKCVVQSAVSACCAASTAIPDVCTTWTDLDDALGGYLLTADRGQLLLVSGTDLYRRDGNVWTDTGDLPGPHIVSVVSATR